MLIKKICEICGDEYSCYPYEQDKRHTCGKKECKSIYISKTYNGENGHNWKGGQITRICEICGDEYSCYSRDQDKRHTCRKKECISKWRSKIRTKEKVKKICEICGDEYSCRQCEKGKRHTCGKKECISKWRSKIRTKEKVKKICEICGDEYSCYPCEKDKRHTCGKKECISKWRSGENNHNWKGGQITRICEICGDEYSCYSRDQDKRHTCGKPECKSQWQSENIRGERHPNWAGGKIIQFCEICGDEYSVYLVNSDKRHTCGKSECKSQWQSKTLSGENSPNWKGGQVVKICEICDDEYLINKAHADKRHTCGKKECKSIYISKTYNGVNSSLFGKPFSEERCIHISMGLQGITDLKDWSGYLTDELYCEKFTPEFKLRVREFQNSECMEGGEIVNKPHVHHLYEQKASCCHNLDEANEFYFNIRNKKFYPSILSMPDNKEKELEYGLNKFVILCDKHHGHARGNKNGKSVFEIIRKYEQIINTKYKGRSYYTREEYWGNGYYYYKKGEREIYYDAITGEIYNKSLNGFQGYGLPKLIKK